MWFSLGIQPYAREYVEGHYMFEQTYDECLYVECGTTGKNVRSHVKLKHEDRVNYTCDQCDYILMNRRNLRLHV